MDFVQVNNDIFLVVEDNAMHYLDDVKFPVQKKTDRVLERRKKKEVYTGGIGRNNLLIFAALGGPKYSAGKAV